MLKPFDRIGKKKPLPERKEAYKKEFINKLEKLKFDIAHRLLNMSEYHNEVQSYFFQRFVTLEERFEPSSLMQKLKEQKKQYVEKTLDLTERLDILREMAEKQQISSEAALLGYQKTLDDDLSDINKIAEEFFQQVNKDTTELLGLFTIVSFKQSDSFFHITDQIRDAICRDFPNIQSKILSPDEHLFKTLSILIDSEELPQALRDQLGSTFEKLISSKNAKFMLLSLNAAFNTVPSQLSEIGGNEKASITARIQGLGRFLDKKTVDPLEHYLTTAQEYFSLLLRLDRDDPNLVNYIEEHLTDDQLLDRLLERYKKNELAALIRLKQAFRTPLDSDVKILKEISEELEDSSEPLNNLMDEYNGRLRALELTFGQNVDDYHKLTSFSDISNYYSTVLEMIQVHSTEIRKKAAEYRVVERIFTNARCLEKEEIDFFFKEMEINNPDYRKSLVNSLTEKIFHLLGKLPASQFDNYIENLLQFAEAEETQLLASAQADYLFLFKKELRNSIRERRLECFIKQQSEKIAEYLNSRRGGHDCGPFSLLNRYLNYCDFSQLEALDKNRPDLKETIERMTSTKQLLDFKNKDHPGSLRQICQWFSKATRYELSLPLFITPQNRNWFFSTMDIIVTLKQAVDEVDNKENNSRVSFFFLKTDTKAKKREALEQLKKQLNALPNLIDSQVLDEQIKNWETKFGAVIDKQRYRFYLIVAVALYQLIKHYILGQAVETKSRHCVEELKEHVYKASAAMQANFQEGMAKNTLPSPTGLTP